jgi:hypothetical protein
MQGAAEFGTVANGWQSLLYDEMWSRLFGSIRSQMSYDHVHIRNENDRMWKSGDHDCTCNIQTTNNQFLYGVQVTHFCLQVSLFYMHPSLAVNISYSWVNVVKLKNRMWVLYKLCSNLHKEKSCFCSSSQLEQKIYHKSSCTTLNANRS